jgi:putative component of membrane protein insertase Oxa1/YidC/SpoIIIJ protein YidD
MLSSLIIFICAIPGFHEPWGKDSDIKYEVPVAPSPKTFSPFSYVAEKVILFHQRVISPVDGPRSHFRPSSSGYMLQAIRDHGFLKGYIMGCDRLLRENGDPWVYRTTLIDGKIWKTDPPK